MIELRSSAELDALGEAGRAVAAALRAVRAHARADVRLSELDELARAVLREHTALPLPLGGDPDTAMSASVNDVVGHGVPDATRLTGGDLLGIDCLARVDGWCARAAATIGIGTVDPEDLILMQTAHQALDDAIAAARPGRRVGDLSHALGVVARSGGYGIPAASGGHGIGRGPREEPPVPGEGRPGRGAPLRPGMVLLLRPVLLAGGGDEVSLADDGSTVVTGDGSRAARAGHTIAITDHGARVLTA
ncbi:M24 family metallopeptidase [Saccharopolyspora erythraea]|nr:M24 family metallopeptidase [Saccharopolyspora erythraea]